MVDTINDAANEAVETKGDTSEIKTLFDIEDQQEFTSEEQKSSNVSAKELSEQSEGITTRG